MSSVLVYGGRGFGALPMRPDGNGPNKAHPRYEVRLAELHFIYATLEKELTVPDDSPNGWHLKDKDLRIIAGGAPGADTGAAEWAIVNWIPLKEYKADWNNITRKGAVIRRRWDGSYYDARAGHVRNQLMIDDGKPTLGIGFPGNAGTRDMAARLMSHGIAVKEFAP